MSAAGVQRVLLKPEPSTWHALAAQAWAAKSADATAFRTQLGLPTDRPIIMTGHQPGFFHPGILAKYIAAHELAKRIQGCAAAVVVDHDAEGATTIETPSRDANGTLSTVTLDCTAAPDHSSDPLPIVAEAVHAARQYFSQASGTPAERAESANASLLSPWFTAQSFNAGEILQTDLGTSLINRMAADPLAVAHAYNDALREHPGTGIRPLRINERNPEQTELPLWWISSTGTRQPVDAHEIATPPCEACLAPRALLLTAILRLAGCELFIHGTGGGVYDRASASWFHSWLGRELAPMVVASADVTLPIEAPGANLEEIASAAWTAHRAKHDPAQLRDISSATAKRALAQEIARSTDKESRLQKYTQMHALLAQYRLDHTEELTDLEEKAVHLRGQVRRARIAGRRDWPAVLHGHAALDALAGEIAHRLARAPVPADVSCE